MLVVQHEDFSLSTALHRAVLSSNDFFARLRLTKDSGSHSVVETCAAVENSLFVLRQCVKCVERVPVRCSVNLYRFVPEVEFQ